MPKFVAVAPMPTDPPRVVGHGVPRSADPARPLPEQFRAHRQEGLVPSRTFLPPERVADLALSEGWVGSRPYLQSPTTLTVLSRPGFDPIALPSRFANKTEMIGFLAALEIPRSNWPASLQQEAP